MRVCNAERRRLDVDMRIWVHEFRWSVCPVYVLMSGVWMRIRIHHGVRWSSRSADILVSAVDIWIRVHEFRWSVCPVYVLMSGMDVWIWVHHGVRWSSHPVDVIPVSGVWMWIWVHHRGVRHWSVHPVDVIFVTVTAITSATSRRLSRPNHSRVHSWTITSQWRYFTRTVTNLFLLYICQPDIAACNNNNNNNNRICIAQVCRMTSEALTHFHSSNQ